MKVKCSVCKKKIPILMVDVYTCKCKNIYCPQHKLDHNCSWNFFEENQNRIRLQNPVIIKSKIEKL